VNRCQLGDLTVSGARKWWIGGKLEEWEIVAQVHTLVELCDFIVTRIARELLLSHQVLDMYG